ncbi:MAG: acyl transferase [Bacteroidota bacterium]
MNSISSFKDDLFKVNDHNFEAKALELFQFQAKYNKVYNEYIKLLDVDIKAVLTPKDIPFLPIEFFKSHHIKSCNWVEETVFKSSGTTGSERSQHFVEDLEFYYEGSKRVFEETVFPLENTAILAILPNYIEQGDSSLIYMIDRFIKDSQSVLSGFYKKESLLELNIQNLSEKVDHILIIGVSYALLDLADSLNSPFDFKNLFLMETGGMKGRRKEITRSELHSRLKVQFGVEYIYSEYGMTELLSQAYALDNGEFQTPPWMKFFIRDINDPFSLLYEGKTGALNIIDLANIHSCAFLETKDLARMNKDGHFEILGRIDNSDIRGCNLLMQ